MMFNLLNWKVELVMTLHCYHLGCQQIKSIAATGEGILLLKMGLFQSLYQLLPLSVKQMVTRLLQ